MTIAEIISGGVLAFILTLIKIPKIELNVWALLARGFGRAINVEMLAEIKALRTEFDAHVKESQEKDVKQTRTRMLRFDDELISGKTFGREMFRDALRDVDFYKAYCEQHPDFINNEAEATMEHIVKVYQEHLDRGEFC